MLSFTLRNLRIFFRQKSAVFFSLMGLFIVIGLYLLFLGDLWVDGFPGIPGIRTLMDNWIIAGLVAITPVTTTMGAFEAMVEDRSRGISRDFLAAPVKRSVLTGGYVLSAYVIGLLMSLVALALGEIYVVASGGSILPNAALIKMLLLLPLSTLASSAMVFFLVSFFRRSATFAAASSIVGTLIGFLTGIYLPTGSLPEYMQWAVKLFPVSHTAVLMRQIMTEQPIAESFGGASPAQLQEFTESMGITFSFGGSVAGAPLHLLVLAGVSVVFFLLAVWNISRKKIQP